MIYDSTEDSRNYVSRGDAELDTPRAPLRAMRFLLLLSAPPRLCASPFWLRPVAGRAGRALPPGQIVRNKTNLPERPPRGAGRGSHQQSRRCGVLRQTNPIPRLRIADHVIASEARQSGLRIQKGLGPAARACGAGCTNKPNLPRYAGRGGPQGRGRGRNAPNEPNLARVARKGRGWPGEPAGARRRQTKPISGGATGGASVLQERSYGTSHVQ
jgi:hypothetical protein